MLTPRGVGGAARGGVPPGGWLRRGRFPEVRGCTSLLELATQLDNSSLAVASDTDKFVVLAADAHHAEVGLDGAIDSDDVRREVIKLLEGGEPTYFLKQRKYNIRDPYGH